MIVVSDTSAITSLLQIGRADILTRIYSEIFIPGAVRDELLQGHSSIPDFIQYRAVADHAGVQRLLAELDLGEAEAIILAKELNADELLIDETLGRRVATREGVNVIGLLGVLLEAKGRGVVNSVREIAEELETKAGFRLSKTVKEILYREAGEL
jgi:predicted nucleic acid-binding protein